MASSPANSTPQKAKRTHIKKAVVSVIETASIEPQTAIPIQQWTDGGAEVLVVRLSDSNGKAYGGFQHPLVVGETVTAPDWDPAANCGGGIHGWAWGNSLGDGKDLDWCALWQVYGVLPQDIVFGEPDLVGKLKFRTGTLRCVGRWDECLSFVNKGQIAWTAYSARGAASATGERGAASATGEGGAASATGWGGAASATGWRGAASATGWMGAASATGEGGAASATSERGAASATGWGGAASATGWRGAASATGGRGAASATGWKGAASATGARGAASATGESGAASATGASGAASATGWSGAAVVTGLYGKAMSGESGCIALAFQRPDGKIEMVCAQTGEGKALKALTWYTLDANGAFVEVSK